MKAAVAAILPAAYLFEEIQKWLTILTVLFTTTGEIAFYFLAEKKYYKIPQGRKRTVRTVRHGASWQETFYFSKNITICFIFLKWMNLEVTSRRQGSEGLSTMFTRAGCYSTQRRSKNTGRMNYLPSAFNHAPLKQLACRCHVASLPLAECCTGYP